MQRRVSALAFVAALAALFLAPVRAQEEGRPEVGKTKAAVCAGCHGIDGNGGADPTWPKLAGQAQAYLYEQLQAFKSGARKNNPVMTGMAAPLSEQDMRDLAAYYASLPHKPGAATNKELALAGQRIYRGGIGENGVAACMSCHGPAGHGIPPRFPRVDGQPTAYTEKQLLDFKAGRRADNDKIMTQLAGRMSDAQIKAVSEYLAGLYLPQ
jgi:cytochrome c553